MMQKILRLLARTANIALNILFVVLLLLADICPFINPTQWVLPSMLGLLFEWLLLINLFFAIGWLFTHHKLRSIFSAVALLCSVASMSYTFAIPHVPNKQFEHTISVVSYNTQRLDDSKKAEQNRILHYIKETDADVVCLQEFETRKTSKELTLQEVKDYLNYPYSYIDFKLYKGQRQYGIAVFSKYPLLNKQELAFDSKTNISARCDIVVGEDTMRLFNNHLQSVRFDNNDMALLSDFADSNDNMKKSASTVWHKLSRAYPQRIQQMNCLCNEIQQSPYPVILCGDFNEVPVSYIYRHIACSLKDAFLQSGGIGLGHSFCKSIFGIRIDYILYSPQLSSADFKIDRLSYSDHYPVRCKIKW